MTITINCSAANSTVAILYSDMMLEHRTGENHPEKPERLSSAVSVVKKNNTLSKYFIWPTITKASNDQIRLVHSNNYINLVKNEVHRLDGAQQVLLSTGDVVISKDSDEAARFAVGAGIAGIDQIMTKKASSAFALVRPPGHHATSNRGMGFCIYNNVAVGANYLINKYKLKKVAIIDFDVHHGNGTQDIFYDNEKVLYISTHQYPYYPGSGTNDEKGKHNNILNIPLPAGTTSEEYLNAYEFVLKKIKEFKPEFILLSAGFDAHKDDPLAQLQLESKDFYNITKRTLELSKQYCDGKVVSILEGGYDLLALQESTEMHVKALLEFN